MWPLGVHAMHAGEHLYLVAEPLERLEDRREVEADPLGRRGPVIHHHPVRDVDDAKSTHRVGCCVAECRESRHHPVEEWQRE